MFFLCNVVFVFLKNIIFRLVRITPDDDNCVSRNELDIISQEVYFTLLYRKMMKQDIELNQLVYKIINFLVIKKTIN